MADILERLKILLSQLPDGEYLLMRVKPNGQIGWEEIEVSIKQKKGGGNDYAADLGSRPITRGVQAELRVLPFPGKTPGNTICAAELRFFRGDNYLYSIYFHHLIDPSKSKGSA
ncbi:MAG TPA: hypothetical protein VMU27_00650 [Candidatus Paceibacterota bacterium]|nr:hypothetical protein [Candidatus Paceibacterota bacterium]